MNKALLILVAMLASSCIEIELKAPAYEVVYFGKGHHRPAVRPDVSKHDYVWVFTQSCLYSIEGEDQIDCNKLEGRGYLSIEGGQHVDSARWAWFPLNGKIYICTYTYANQSRDVKIVDSVAVGEPIRLAIRFDGYSAYYYTVQKQNQPERLYQEPKLHNKKLRFDLYSYMGGNRPAVQPITILKYKNWTNYERR